MKITYNKKEATSLPRVCVLLSSYNGEKYIELQLKSIFAQEGVCIHVIVRDDGSTDNTISIINNLKNIYKNITLIKGDNIGCEKSFLELLYMDLPKADYYAFSDQDDFWLKDKISNSINLIKECDEPAISGMNLLACDNDLAPIKTIHSSDDICSFQKHRKVNYLCNAHGCVLVWNEKLQRVIQKYRPQIDVAHDVWVCAIANAVGTMVLSVNTGILYRLHNNNVSAYGAKKIDKLKKRFRLYFGKNHPQRDKIAREILIGYSKWIHVNENGYENLILLKNYNKSLSNRIMLIKSNIFEGLNMKYRLLWKLCIIFGKY